MPTSAPARPAAGEHAEYFAAYISKVPDGDVRTLLAQQLPDTIAYIKSRGDAWAMSRYAPGKWSVKEVINHVADAERVFSYRAMRIARGDQTALPGFDENAWVPMTNADARALSSLLDELSAVRAATIALFNSFDDAAWKRIGNASGKPVSARAIAYIACGHERHHLAVLKERYV